MVHTETLKPSSSSPDDATVIKTTPIEGSVLSSHTVSSTPTTIRASSTIFSGKGDGNTDGKGNNIYHATFQKDGEL